MEYVVAVSFRSILPDYTEAMTSEVLIRTAGELFDGRNFHFRQFQICVTVLRRSLRSPSVTFLDGTIVFLVVLRRHP